MRASLLISAQDYIRFLAEARRVAANIAYYATGTVRRGQVLANMANLERECLIALDKPLSLCQISATAPLSAPTSTARLKAAPQTVKVIKSATTATGSKSTQMAIAFD